MVVDRVRQVCFSCTVFFHLDCSRHSDGSFCPLSPQKGGCLGFCRQTYRQLAYFVTVCTDRCCCGVKDLSKIPPVHFEKSTTRAGSARWPSKSDPTKVTEYASTTSTATFHVPLPALTQKQSPYMLMIHLRLINDLPSNRFNISPVTTPPWSLLPGLWRCPSPYLHLFCLRSKPAQTRVASSKDQPVQTLNDMFSS